MAVVNSSVVRPHRCAACREFFYQSGLGLWFAFTLLFPTGLVFAIDWKAGVVAAAVEVFAAAVLVNRRRPLMPGPKNG